MHERQWVRMYEDPGLYDILSTPGTAGEIDVLERIFRCFGSVPEGRPVCLEPACGTGRNLRVLAGRGWRVFGFDLDPAMVAYAQVGLRRRGFTRRAKVYTASMDQFSARIPDGSIDLAYIPDNSLRHLLSDRATQAHLEGVERALGEGGLYVVGLSVVDPDGEPPEEDVWTATRGHCRVTQVVNYLPSGDGGAAPRRERVLSHLMVERPGGLTHHDSVYELRTYTERQWRRLLNASGLRRLAVLDRFGRERGERILPYQLEVLISRRDGRMPSLQEGCPNQSSC